LFARQKGIMQVMTPAEQPDNKKNTVCIALGKSLKALRIDANKSQELLAFDAEVDRTYISAIERGIANPSVLTLASLCYALNINLSDLFASVQVNSRPEDARRANSARPSLKPAKSRLR
jgi:transcriptional regulator with XRE-family HTH domain